ncbi:MAG TPA: hypothetical protein VE007_05895 [Thermoanaerobaculia bacterium]|nr:hypothetical protein [Thermoanaerobaculia bacterium]
MTARADLLEKLRTKVRAPVERRADEILDGFGDDNEGLAAFQLARADLDALITRLERDELRAIDQSLAAHQSELLAGIHEMGESLHSVKTLSHAAEIFGTVVGLVARIVALA